MAKERELTPAEHAALAIFDAVRGFESLAFRGWTRVFPLSGSSFRVSGKNGEVLVRVEEVSGLTLEERVARLEAKVAPAAGGGA